MLESSYQGHMLYDTRHFQASACMAKCTHTKCLTYHHFQRHAELDSGQGKLRCHPSKVSQVDSKQGLLVCFTCTATI